MTKYRAKSFNKIEFSYTDKEGDMYWLSIMTEICQYVCQTLRLSEKIFHKILPQLEVLRDQGHNT